RHELVAVVHGERVPDEIGKNRARARPCLHDFLFVALVQPRHLFGKVVSDEWALLYATRHYENLTRVSSELPYRVFCRAQSCAAMASSDGASSRLPYCPTCPRR